ncbi:MAG: hypothetical protein AAFX58_14890, partial [Pseudomonadota bacterium]
MPSAAFRGSESAMPNVQIRGPILSVEDLLEHQRFFGKALAMEPTATARFSSTQTGCLLGLGRHAMETVFYRRAPTDFGVRLWRIAPAHAETVRSPERGTDVDALKVIDFYAPAFDDSIKALADAGFSPEDAIARYALPEGEFLEAHFWRPDNVVCAVISGPTDFFAGMVTTSDQSFSEPQSISAPVSDVAAVVDFYERVFGLSPLHRYEFSNPSFDAMVGADEPLNLSGINIGTDLRAPYLGVIDYGKTNGGARSLAGRSRPPMRGLIGVELLVDDMTAVVGAA